MICPSIYLSDNLVDLFAFKKDVILKAKVNKNDKA